MKKKAEADIKELMVKVNEQNKQEIKNYIIEAKQEHLCFKQAQPKVCHSPKVDDAVEMCCPISWTNTFGHFF